MARKFTPKVVTANDLLEGDVIYLAAGGWVRRHQEAELLEEEAAAEARLAAAAADRMVVGAYLADAVAGPEGPEPVHFREGFRATGPSTYTHGAAGARKEAADV